MLTVQHNNSVNYLSIVPLKNFKALFSLWFILIFSNVDQNASVIDP
jgi:hypothetical protein